MLIGLVSITRKRTPADVAQLMLQHRHWQVRNLGPQPALVGLAFVHWCSTRRFSWGVASLRNDVTIARSSSEQYSKEKPMISLLSM